MSHQYQHNHEHTHDTVEVWKHPKLGTRILSECSCGKSILGIGLRQGVVLFNIAPYGVCTRQRYQEILTELQYELTDTTHLDSLVGQGFDIAFAPLEAKIRHRTNEHLEAIRRKGGAYPSEALAKRSAHHHTLMGNPFVPGARVNAAVRLLLFLAACGFALMLVSSLLGR